MGSKKRAHVETAKPKLQQRETVWIAIGFAVLHLLIGLALLTPAPYEGGDNAAYLALGKSLLQHRTYTELWDPAQKTATLYPPLFPAVLAGAVALGLNTWLQLKILTLSISAVAVGFSVLWLRRISGVRTALAGGFILALSPGILAQSSYVLSEGLFWAFTMLALWAVSHIQMLQPRTVGADIPDETKRSRWLIMTAVAVAAAALTRSTGLPLIVAIGTALLIRKRWRDLAIFAAIAVTPTVLWSIRGRIVGVPGYSSYLTMVDPYQPEMGTIDIVGFVQRIASNVVNYATSMAPGLVWTRDVALRPLAIVLIIVALAWWVFRLVRKPDVPELWLLFYTGLLAIWPEMWAGERFVLAIVPALIYFMADLLRTLHQRTPKGGLIAAVCVLALTLGLMPPVLLAETSQAALCREQARAEDEFVCMSTGFSDFMRVAGVLGDSLPPRSVVISRKPTLFYAQSGLRSAMYPLSNDAARFFATADSINARYVVVDQLSALGELYLNHVILSTPERFCLEDALSRDHALVMQILRVPRANAAPADSTGYVPMPDCKDVP